MNVGVTAPFYLVKLFMPHLAEDKTMGVYMAEPVADFMAVCFTIVLFVVQFRKALHKLTEQ